MGNSGLKSCADASGVLLAGGRSVRMGRDKAQLMVGGQPLWMRQLEVLRTAGVGEVFVSGAPGGPWGGGAETWTVVVDSRPGSGPLGGLAAALEAMKGRWLVVLAVDMPCMEAAYLRGLLESARALSRGVVPVLEDLAEPLAAVYPREMGDLALHGLRTGEFSLRHWVREGVRRGLVELRDVSGVEKPFFLNLNTQADYARFGGGGA